MHIKDISNEQCAQFVEDYLSNIKNDNFSSGPIKIKKLKEQIVVCKFLQNDSKNI